MVQSNEAVVWEIIIEIWQLVFPQAITLTPTPSFDPQYAQIIPDIWKNAKNEFKLF